MTTAMTYTEVSGRTLPLLRLGLGYGALVDETTATWAVLAMMAPHKAKKGADPTLRKLSFTVSADAPLGMRGLYLTRATARFIASRPDCPEEFREILRDQLENP